MNDQASVSTSGCGRVILFANTDWYLFNFRLPLARALSAAGFEVIMISPHGPYGDALRRLGFEWIPVAMDRRSLNPFAELRLLFRLSRLFRQWNPVAVHGFTIKCAVYAALVGRWHAIAARISAVAGMGYVFTSEDLKARLLRGPVKWLMRAAFGGRGSMVVVQNPDDWRAMMAAGIAENQLRLIPGSGVDTRRFARIERQRSEDGRPRVVLAARMLRDKGVAEFVDAGRLLASRGRQVRCILAGEPDPGNPASIPAPTLQQWTDEGHVQWLGLVRDITDLLAQTDIMVLPSYREGLPRSLIEAAAAGIPIITANVPGCTHVVSHQTDGLIVPVRDPVAIADAIELLLDDPELAQRLACAAQAKAVERFDERRIVAETLDVYEELLGSQRPEHDPC